VVGVKRWEVGQEGSRVAVVHGCRMIKERTGGENKRDGNLARICWEEGVGSQRG